MWSYVWLYVLMLTVPSLSSTLTQANTNLITTGRNIGQKQWHHSGRPPYLCAGRPMMLSITGSLSSIVNYPEENNIRGLNGTRSRGRPDMAVLYDYTTCWLSACQVSPYSPTPTLMNGCNMSRITTRHATLSLMASHNARDVPPVDSQRGKRERRRWRL